MFFCSEDVYDRSQRQDDVSVQRNERVLRSQSIQSSQRSSTFRPNSSISFVLERLTFIIVVIKTLNCYFKSR